MPAFWLTYVPKEESPHGWPLDKLRSLIKRIEASPDAEDSREWWRISGAGAGLGDRVYIFKQGTKSPRGVIGVGKIVDGPERHDDDMETSHEQKSPKKPRMAKIRFQKLVDPTEKLLLPLEELNFVPKKLINALSSGMRVDEDVDDKLKHLLARVLAPVLESKEGDNFIYDPESVQNEQERAWQAIRIRRGQPAFRNELLAAYGGRCAITDCGIEDVLEAAHIRPYSESSSYHVCNGLLLRADIHTLFDCNLLAFDPETRQLVLADQLKDSEYAHLPRQVLREPSNPADRPSQQHLAERLAKLQK